MDIRISHESNWWHWWSMQTLLQLRCTLRVVSVQQFVWNTQAKPLKGNTFWSARTFHFTRYWIVVPRLLSSRISSTSYSWSLSYSSFVYTLMGTSPSLMVDLRAQEILPYFAKIDLPTIKRVLCQLFVIEYSYMRIHCQPCFNPLAPSRHGAVTAPAGRYCASNFGTLS